MSITGRTLRELAQFVGVDLGGSFGDSGDWPAIGDPDAPIILEPRGSAELTAWFGLGTEALDRILVDAQAPSVVQLWPEHFDVAFDLATVHGQVNLGSSPGDSDLPEPYLYVAPWDVTRPGDPDFWNAPFGAVLERDAVLATPDPLVAATEFFHQGLHHLA